SADGRRPNPKAAPVYWARTRHPQKLLLQLRLGGRRGQLQTPRRPVVLVRWHDFPRRLLRVAGGGYLRAHRPGFSGFGKFATCRLVSAEKSPSRRLNSKLLAKASQRFSISKKSCLSPGSV